MAENTARQISNANVAKDELEKVGELKSIERSGECWQARFKNGVLNFQTQFDIVGGVNVLHIYPDSEIEMNDTLVVNLTFEI